MAENKSSAFKMILMGCGAVLLLGCLGVVSLFWFNKDKIKAGKEFFAQVSEIQKKSQAFAASHPFTPPADNSVQTEQLDRFLAAAAALPEHVAAVNAGQRKAESLSQQDEKSVTEGLGVVKTILSGYEGMMDTLDQAGIGFAEFLYVGEHVMRARGVLAEQAAWMAPDAVRGAELEKRIQELAVLPSPTAEEQDELARLRAELLGPQAQSGVSAETLQWMQDHIAELNDANLDEIMAAVRDLGQGHVNVQVESGNSSMHVSP